MFKINSKYQPAGDQIQAIKKLANNVNNNVRDQVLLGVTGSGKTFTMAQVIQQTQRPAIIMAHNKILAYQLYKEMKNFFPHNSVEYFISFFDYYQPEAYVPSSDLYIDKDSKINDTLEQMKLSAMYSCIEKRDTIVVASVSAIYPIGDPKAYSNLKIDLEVDLEISPQSLARKLVELQYERNDIEFKRGSFRVKGDIIEIFPAHLEESAVRVSFFGDNIESIHIVDPLTGKKQEVLKKIRLFSTSLFATPFEQIKNAIPKIEKELEERIKYFKDNSKFIEAQRIEERTRLDIEMLQTTGYCNGIEHYSRYLQNIEESKRPYNIFDYLHKDAILFVDESHVSVPQIRAMYKADRNRKVNLSQYGFRLPSCLDNRPLNFEEWNEIRPNTVFVSATPSSWELELTSGEAVEQIIRPTGLLDPVCIIRPVESETTNQIDDLMQEAKELALKNQRVLAVTITKKSAEKLTDYLNENGVKARYMHSDIDTTERVEIIRDLRKGVFDVLVGINLLREGLDIPECTLVAILDADKEGFLRSRTSLIQTIGRAARNAEGRAILYANNITDSMKEAMFETERRRKIQSEWNKKHGITPKTVFSAIGDDVDQDAQSRDYVNIGFATHSKFATHSNSLKKEAENMNFDELDKTIEELRKQMLKASKDLEFEKALELRDKIKILSEKLKQS